LSDSLATQQCSVLPDTISFTIRFLALFPCNRSQRLNGLEHNAFRPFFFFSRPPLQPPLWLAQSLPRFLLTQSPNEHAYVFFPFPCPFPFFCCCIFSPIFAGDVGESLLTFHRWTSQTCTFSPLFYPPSGESCDSGFKASF